MNKKILSIFALIMAISILGVSCAKDNNTTNPTPTTTPPITLDQAKKIVATLTTPVDADSASFNLSAVKNNVKTSGANFTLEVSDNTGSLTVDYATFLDAVKGLKTAMDAAENNLITVDGNNIRLVVAKDGDTTAIATIPYTTKDKKNGNFVITFKLTGNGSTFAYTEIALTTVQTAIVTALGSTTGISVGEDGNITDGTAGQKFTFANGSGATAITGTGVALTTGKAVTLSSFTDLVIGKINETTVDNASISTAVSGSSTADAGNASPLVLTVTVAPNDGYKMNNDGSTITVTITPLATGGTVGTDHGWK